MGHYFSRAYQMCVREYLKKKKKKCLIATKHRIPDPDRNRDRRTYFAIGARHLRALTWRPATRRTNRWRTGSEIYWTCCERPVPCRLIARKLSAPRTSTAHRSPETACRIYCISPSWLPCNCYSRFTHTHVHAQQWLVYRVIS